jgi:hypothetical protein
MKEDERRGRKRKEEEGRMKEEQRREMKRKEE